MRKRDWQDCTFSHTNGINFDQGKLYEWMCTQSWSVFSLRWFSSWKYHKWVFSVLTIRQCDDWLPNHSIGIECDFEWNVNQLFIYYAYLTMIWSQRLEFSKTCDSNSLKDMSKLNIKSSAHLCVNHLTSVWSLSLTSNHSFD